MIRYLALLLAVICAGCTQAAVQPKPVASKPVSPTVSADPASTAATAGASLTTSARPRATAPATAPASVSGRPTAAGIPPVSAAARAAGFLDVHTVLPDAVVELHYATSDNFTGVRLYPADARCLIHQSMAAGLRTAAARLRAEGYVLVFWDCYRPHDVQVRMFQIVPNPNWVARPGPYSRSHETGRSVDVTLARTSCLATRQLSGCLLDMGTGFDDFTSRAYAYASDGLSTTERADRAVLRTAMEAGGLTVYSGEWWHFDGPGAFTHRPIVNVPVD